MRMRVSDERKPVWRLYPVRFLYFPMRILGPFSCESTVAVTTTSAGAICGSPEPPASSTAGVKDAPSSSARRSTSSRSPSRTRYCLPPTEMIA